MTITLTIRVIKSFEFRTTKNMILKDVDPSLTIQDLKTFIQRKIEGDNAFRVYRTTQLDTLMLYFKAHETKTQNLIINFNNKFLDDGSSLRHCGIENETELSYFNADAYTLYKSHPETKW